KYFILVRTYLKNILWPPNVFFCPYFVAESLK
ncbi:MAG: hypothetical protein ACI85G_000585, partial [Psychroserpens sp.]